jgi:hypothetical protein
MGHQHVQVTVLGASGFDYFSGTSTYHQACITAQVQATAFLVGVVATQALGSEDGHNVVIESNLIGFLTVFFFLFSLDSRELREKEC